MVFPCSLAFSLGMTYAIGALWVKNDLNQFAIRCILLT